MKTALVTHGGGFVTDHLAATLGLHGYDVDRQPTRTTPYDLVVSHVSAGALFEWARENRPRVLVFLSDAEVYPAVLQRPPFETYSVIPGQYPVITPGARPVNEIDANLDAIDPMTLSARGRDRRRGELLASALADTDIRVLIPRLFEVYSTVRTEVTDPFTAMIDAALASQDPFPVPGDGTEIRDFIHVSDAVGMILAALGADLSGPVNICSGAALSLNELAVAICEAAHYQPWIFHDDRPSARAPYQVGNPGRIARFYRQQVTLPTAIQTALLRAGDPPTLVRR